MRIVIAEDNALLREGISLLDKAVGHEVVGIATSGPEIVPTLLKHRPDIAVVDVRLPPNFRDEGLRAAVEARAQLPDLPILVLSQYVEQTYASELLRIRTKGTGYLLKDRIGRVEEFVDALDRVAAGGMALDPEVVSQLMNRHDPLDVLTAREREVLHLMAQGHDNLTIARLLVVSDHAVTKHIGNIFRKLDLPASDSGHRRVLAVLAYLNS